MTETKRPLLTSSVATLVHTEDGRLLAVAEFADYSFDEARAEFIVRACNAHDGLLVALNRMLNIQDDVLASGCVLSDEAYAARDCAQTAIAKATETVTDTLEAVETAGPAGFLPVLYRFIHRLVGDDDDLGPTSSDDDGRVNFSSTPPSARDLLGGRIGEIAAAATAKATRTD